MPLVEHCSQIYHVSFVLLSKQYLKFHIPLRLHSAVKRTRVPSPSPCLSILTPQQSHIWNLYPAAASLQVFTFGHLCVCCQLIDHSIESPLGLKNSFMLVQGRASNALKIPFVLLARRSRAPSCQLRLPAPLTWRNASAFRERTELLLRVVKCVRRAIIALVGRARCSAGNTLALLLRVKSSTTACAIKGILDRRGVLAELVRRILSSRQVTLLAPAKLDIQAQTKARAALVLQASTRR